MQAPSPRFPDPVPIRADLADADLRRRGRRRAAVASGLGALLLAGGLVALFTWRLVFADLPTIPPDAQLWSLNRPPGMTFLDRTGAVIATRGSHHGAPARLAELPAYVPKAFLAAEDRRFYTHAGVDLHGVARALKADVTAGHVVEGGSTITQQLVRTVLLGPEQTFKRKVQEGVLAVALERRLSKDAILELYLNRIYFGAGAYGIEAAARTYFGKPARALSLPEAALLAALPKAPSRLDPTNDLAAAQARAAIVLGRMQGLGWIDERARLAAVAHPATLTQENLTEGEFGYALDVAAQEARAAAGGLAPDLVVKLTVDRELQTLAARTVREAVAEGRGRGGREAALVALYPDGGVAALQGGLDHRDTPFNRAAQALRQPGSAFKPMVYAAALEEGDRPEDVRVDAPTRFGAYAPQNYGGGFSGPVTLEDALARSINTVAVRLTHELGADRVAGLARRFGLSSIPVKPALPVALGAYEVRLIDLVSAYQVFQNGGVRRPAHIVDLVSNARGDVLWRRPGDAAGVYDPVRAATMTRMLQGVIQHGTGRAADIGRPAAGKTGTTQNYRDAWFVGFTPDLAAGVWLGDDRGRPMAGIAGGDVPARAWSRFMAAALAGVAVSDFPDPEAPTPAEAADARATFYDGLARALEDAAR